MASELLKTFQKIERGRAKCIAKANEKNYTLPENASLEELAKCLDAQAYISDYVHMYTAILSGDYENCPEFRIPTSVTKVAMNAFKETDIQNIIFHDDITSIGSDAFASTKLKTINLPPNLKTIGDRAFSSCTDVENDIVIPETVTSIGTAAFSGVGESIAREKTITIPSSVTSLNNTVCKGFAIVNWYTPVNKIPDYTCAAASSTKSYNLLKEFNISDELLNNITSIGTEAFLYQSVLTKLPIGRSVTTIGSKAFQYCSNVTEPVIIPKTCTSIGSNAFQNAKLKGGISFDPECATTLNTYVFNNTDINTGILEIPENVTLTKDYALQAVRKEYVPAKNNVAAYYVQMDRVEVYGDEFRQFGSQIFNGAYIIDLIIHAATHDCNYNGLFNSQNIYNIVFPNLSVDCPGNSNDFNTTGLGKGGIYVPDDIVATLKTKTGWSGKASYIKPISTWSGYSDYLEREAARNSTEE